MSELKLEVGKRYLRRDGKITDPLCYYYGSLSNPFYDIKYQESYNAKGRWNDIDRASDLISEYVKPKNNDFIDALKYALIGVYPEQIKKEEKKMKKEPLKVGDRVRVYSYLVNPLNEKIIHSYIGHIEVICDNKKCYIKSEYGSHQEWLRSCVRIKPKKKNMVIKDGGALIEKYQQTGMLTICTFKFDESREGELPKINTPVEITLKWNSDT